MKKTLYQILGVDPKASTQEIEAIYSVRVEELKMATIQDPNKLVILQQSKEILCDPAQRAAYDISISGPVAGAPIPADEEPERTFIQQWGKWIVAGVVLIGVVVLWPRHDAAPPTRKPPPKPVASVPVEPLAQSAGERAAVPAEPGNVAPPVPSPADTSADPVLGEWSCTDAISGRSSKYSFRPDGELSIASSDSPALALKYQVSGNTLTLTEPGQARLTIEELVARKMILNTGAEGRRLVCTR